MVIRHDVHDFLLMITSLSLSLMVEIGGKKMRKRELYQMHERMFPKTRAVCLANSFFLVFRYSLIIALKLPHRRCVVTEEWQEETTGFCGLETCKTDFRNMIGCIRKLSSLIADSRPDTVSVGRDDVWITST